MSNDQLDARSGRVSVTADAENTGMPPTDVAVVTLDADGRITDWGADARALTGWSADAISGDTFTRIYAENQWEVAPDAIVERAREDRLYEDERWVRRADGPEFWAKISITPVSGDGMTSGFRVVLQDRTEQKRVEDERSLLASVIRGVAEADSFGDGIETALKAVCEHTQWAYGEAWVAKGNQLEQLVAHAENEQLETFRERSKPVTFSAGEGLPGRVWASKAPEWIPDASAEPPSVFHRTAVAESVGLQAAVGVPITTGEEVVAVLTFALCERRPADEELVAVVSDVAADLGGLMARKRIRDRLARERTLLERIFDTNPTGLVVTDAERTVVRANNEAAEVFGLPEEDLIGSSLHQVADRFNDRDGESLPERALPDAKVLETGSTAELECEVERTDGEAVWVKISATPIETTTDEIGNLVVTIDDITDRKERERTLRRQRNSLERIRRITENLRPISRELVRAGTREDIEDIVCEELVKTDTYLFAWIGEYNAATGEILPRNLVGVEESFVSELHLSLFGDGSSDHYGRAVTERSVQSRNRIPMDDSVHRDHALNYGYQSRAVIPIVYGETVHGVLSVYSARPDAFDEYERELLVELGERIGHAINAAEHKQLLHTDTVVELEFEIGDGSPLVPVAHRLDCRLTLNNLTPGSETTYVCYVDVDGADPERVRETVTQQSTIEQARVVKSRGQTGTIEVTGELGPVTALVDHGATVRSFEVTPDGATLVAETAPHSDIKSIITSIQGESHDTAFVAKRTLDRETKAARLTTTAVEERLTDRQREALELAYHAGYFASPRDSTGQELAEALGISAPTFYRHVRKALEKIVELLVDGHEDTPASE